MYRSTLRVCVMMWLFLAMVTIALSQDSSELSADQKANSYCYDFLGVGECRDMGEATCQSYWNGNNLPGSGCQGTETCRYCNSSVVLYTRTCVMREGSTCNATTKFKDCGAANRKLEGTCTLPDEGSGVYACTCENIADLGICGAAVSSPECTP